LRRLKPKEQEACGRLEAITRVRAGQSTVAAAARALGISRKTYYEWEDRALEAVTEALQDRRPGRPAKPVDPEKEELRQRLAELQRQNILLEETLALRRRLADLSVPSPPPQSGRSPPCKKNGGTQK